MAEAAIAAPKKTTNWPLHIEREYGTPKVTNEARERLACAGRERAHVIRQEPPPAPRRPPCARARSVFKKEIDNWLPQYCKHGYGPEVRHSNLTGNGALPMR